MVLLGQVLLKRTVTRSRFMKSLPGTMEDGGGGWHSMDCWDGAPSLVRPASNHSLPVKLAGSGINEQIENCKRQIILPTTHVCFILFYKSEHGVIFTFCQSQEHQKETDDTGNSPQHAWPLLTMHLAAWHQSLLLIMVPTQAWAWPCVRSGAAATPPVYLFSSSSFRARLIYFRISSTDW